jgi:hypothetical protein
MFHALKNYFYWPITCKQCGFKSNLGLVMLYHLRHTHYQKLGWPTIKWALRYGVEFRIVSLPFLLVWALIMCICWPFWWVYENFNLGVW